jgi:SsrA-binding protein
MRYFNKDSLDYEFKEKLEAGLVLSGSDVKSLRTQGVQFKGAKVEVVNGIPSIFNLHITPYKFAQSVTVDTTTERKLLLTQKEIAQLLSFRNQKYMIIPIAIFTKGRWFKVDLGIGRKLRKFEKREKIKKEEMKKSLK